MQSQTWPGCIPKLALLFIVYICYFLDSAAQTYKDYSDKMARTAIGDWLRQSGSVYKRNITLSQNKNQS